MINVYSENTTNFNNNGLATLIPLTAEFSSDINGAWTLSITHPYDAEERYKHLVKNAILQADVGCIREQSSKQLFRIYDVKKNLQSLSIIAFPIGMEATFDAPIEEIKIPNETGVLTASGVDAAAVLDNYVKTHDDNNKYTVSSNVATQSCSQWENSNLIAAISGSDDNAFINKWGGEVLYNNYAITIKNRIGNASPKFPVEYGKNLTGMEHNLDMSTVITRAYPLSTDGLRLHQYDDLDIDYWYGTFDGDQKKNYAKSQYLYNYNDHTWYQFDSNGKLLTDPIPAEMLAILDQFDWHENETGWWYGLDSTYYIKNGWVEDANGKHYWMDSQGYMDSQWTDTDVWTWNQYDDSGEHYGEKRNSFIDSEHIREYPYKRSAFLSSPYALLDTNSNSNSITANATKEWTAALLQVIEDKAEELWNTILNDKTNTYNAEYIQNLINEDGGIIQYTQARYVYSHKGWQSLIKSLISEGISWIKDEELDEEKWISVNGYMYGDFDTDGNFKNYPKSQYLYCYSKSKWYYFEADGLMSTDEIPAETIALLNTYDWHTDSIGTYYGDTEPKMFSCWIENSNGTHSWVNAEGYYEAQWDDPDTWDWTNINGWRYGRSSTQYVRSCYVEIDKNLEYFGADGFWRDWMRVPAEDMGWYQVKDGANAGKWWYGSLNRYYAHNEYVYMTVNGTLEEWWYDIEGWYDEDKSGETDYSWHEDTTGHWFGTEDEDTGEKDKYIHDKWAYIDGTYYWFDSDGYISGDASKAKQDWAWGDQVDEVTGKHWFGNTDESFNRMWLASQYMKLDNEWYFFDSDGYMIDRNTKKSQTISWFSTEIVTALNPVADLMLKAAYDLLYTQMTTWVQKQFEDGLDKPQITVSVNLVDLSRTSEYAEYAELEKIYLGDSVRCIDTVHGMSIDARVVGLNYDLIRGYNTKVTIGQLAKNLSQILSVSYNGSGKDTSVDNIIAGDGVQKDGNVISATGTPGTSYGIQDVIYEGASLVSGNVAVLDEVIPEVIDVVANPEAEATDDLTKLQVDGVVYQLRGGGLQYWIETENEIYRMGKVDGISTNVDGYIFDYSEWSTRNSISQLYAQFDFKKANDKLAICAKIYNLYSTRNLYFVLISTDAEAIEWVYRNPMLYSEFLSPEEGMALHNGDRYRGKDTASFVYGGYTWYISMGSFGPASYTCTSDFLTFVPSETETLSDLGMDLLETIGGKGYTDVKTGIGNADKILYQKVGNDFVAYLDDTGAFEGTDYKVNGESLIAKINAKQDKLIQGTNITIGADGKTISATDTDEVSELTDVELTDLADGQVLKWDSTNSKWVNAEESGGSEVIANPSETATDTLSKISIDGTVYGIEGGGNGYTEDVLWNTGGTTSSWASPLVITLSENISDYDAIRVSFTDVDGNDGFVFIPTSEIPSNYADKYFVGAGDFLATVKVNSDTSINCYAKNGIAMTYNNVVGINYGSGGGSGGGGGSSEVTYSTTEKKIGKWIDDSDLYQITLEISGSYRGNSDITIANFPSDAVVHQYNGIISYLEGGVYKPVGQGVFTYPLNSYDKMRLGIGSGTFTIVGTLTIQYTKTS